MTVLLVAHGTRNPSGVAVARELAATVGARLPDRPLRLAFVDVLGPTIGQVLAEADGPVTVVPAFLATGHHVRVDVALAVTASGRRDITLTRPLGPHPPLAAAVTGRLRAAGWCPDDAVVLAAAGSRDPRAVADVRAAATALSARVDQRVRIGFLAAGTPALHALVANLRRTGHRRVAVASWLLAPGLFHRRATGCGADVVADPLGTHPAIVQRLVHLAAGLDRECIEQLADARP